AYVLNLSLQQHAVNTAAIALAQKTITIIDGQGRGQSAKIVDYDPESKEYTLDREWTTPPNETSQFEISYRLAAEFPGQYPPTTAPYPLVLAAPPTQDVVINVVPALTRTYNSDLAFDPAANFGQNEAVQVRVATPRASVTLHGTPASGETWTLTFTDATLSPITTISVPVASGDQLSDLAGKFITAINGA